MMCPQTAPPLPPLPSAAPPASSSSIRSLQSRRDNSQHRMRHSFLLAVFAFLALRVLPAAAAAVDGIKIYCSRTESVEENVAEPPPTPAGVVYDCDQEGMPENATHAVEYRLDEDDALSFLLRLHGTLADHVPPPLNRFLFDIVSRVEVPQFTIAMGAATAANASDLSFVIYGSLVTIGGRFIAAPAPQLQHLDLRGLGVRSVAEEAFVHCIGERFVLELSSNRIDALPKEVFRRIPALRTLKLGENQLKEIEGIFSRLPELVELDLSMNNIEEITIDTFTRTPKLQTIDLSENRIEHIDAKAFFNTVHLRALDLYQNHIHTYLELDVSYSRANKLLIDIGSNQIERIIVRVTFDSVEVKMTSQERVRKHLLEIYERSVDEFDEDAVRSVVLDLSKNNLSRIGWFMVLEKKKKRRKGFEVSRHRVHDEM